jgi:replication-associated recombination protein RarA
MKELGYGVKNINIRIDYDNNFAKTRILPEEIKETKVIQENTNEKMNSRIF